jgi:uncharacterized protein YbjT (DUF2867 family)
MHDHLGPKLDGERYRLRAMVTVVFGARGNVGRHVAAGLRAAGVPVRATSRNPDPAQTELVAADLERPETLPAVLDGAEKVFLYAKPLGVDGFVTAARSAGVRHVVLLSSAAVVSSGAEQNPIAQAHRTVELALEESGIDWTFIRPGIFATNALWWWRRSIRTEGVVRAPYPDAHTAPIHEKDMAALAVTALTGSGHAGRAYTAYGPRSVTVRQQVEQIGQAIGREIGFEVIPVDEARAELGRIMPPFVAEGIIRLWAAGAGRPAEVSTIVEEITGRPGYTFAQWARDHADDFR